MPDGPPSASPVVGRLRLRLTPFGAGLFSLCFPGTVIAVASRQVSMVALALGAAVLLVLDTVIGRRLLDGVGLAVAGPAVTTPDRPMALDVDLSAGHPVELDLEVPRATTAIAALAPGRIGPSVNPGGRGVVDRITVRVGTDAPFGLIATSRTIEVLLDRPIHVGPVPAAATPVRPPPAGCERTAGRGEPIGLRPYRSGDSPRDVHWPAVARTGSLMVRDRSAETSAAPAVDVVVVLPADEVAADEAAGQARSAVESLLATGCRVRLTTAEPAISAVRGLGAPSSPGLRRRLGRRPGDRSGQQAGATEPGPDGAPRWETGPVRKRDEVAARLARAVGGRPGAGAPPVSGTHPVLTIDPQGMRWSPGS